MSKRPSSECPKRPAGSGSNSGWTAERAERHLRSLELFGMRFGLDRMRRMMTALDSPQRRFQTIHVVGTNGKTSTTRMIAEILQRHDLRVGSYTSPHLVSYSERVQVQGEDVQTHAFAAAVARAAHAAERVNRTLADGDHVTQFELLTAAALWELARQDVEVAVIEAGLGGRFDATNVIDSNVAVLTNVGLEHTRWLGPTVRDIAIEKLAVLGRRSVLVVPNDLPAETMALARRSADECEARLLLAPLLPPDLALAAAGDFQRRNFALARAAAEAYLSGAGMRVREREILLAGAQVSVPGRLQTIDADPLTILDGAHNPPAAEALVDALVRPLAGRPSALVLGVLEDKDAAAMLSLLLPRFERAWFTAPPSSRALSPAALASLARQLGFERSVCEPSPARALRAARDWAIERGAGAAVVATGSVYLVGDLLSRELPGDELPARASSSHASPGNELPARAHSSRALADRETPGREAQNAVTSAKMRPA